MQNNYEEIITRQLKMTEEQQKTALRKFSTLDIVLKIQILKKYSKLSYVLRQNNRGMDVAMLSYIALVQSISMFIESEAQSINALKIKKTHKRSRKKSEKLIERWALVKELHQKNSMSFRDIAIYLEKYHKLKVAHSTIFEMWQKLENEEKQNG